MSAMVQVKNANGELIKARALLDTCATANFITHAFASRLKLPMKPFSVQVGTMDGMNTVTKKLINIRFTSIHNKIEKSLSFLTVDKIAELVPNEVFPREKMNIPANLQLADPLFHVPRPVDILIASGPSISLLSVGQINLSCNDCDLYLQKTVLGWVVVGGMDISDTTRAKIESHQSNKKRSVSCHLTNLNAQIEQFWNIEEVSTKPSKSYEEEQCEAHYLNNTTRGVDGRYTVRLPFKFSNQDLGESRTRALRRFHALERKLNADEALKTEYNRVMQEYINLGHMSLSKDETENGYYMPHHAVIKSSSSTTKLRVVFDASAKTSANISLNEALMVGPTIQHKLFEHVLRFRTHKYVLTADIEKMYRQIYVHPDDRKYQKIFWYNNNQIQTYEMNTVTFGVSSAPYLAIRTINKLADDEALNFPRATEVLKRDLYVDDLLTGSNSLDEIIELRDEIIELLKRGGFNIRQWASNHNHALDNIDEKIFEADCAINEATMLKTLEIIWKARSYQLTYTTTPIALSTRTTKRKIFSHIAKVFDPLGLLAPIIMYAKIIMQECWKTKIDWDETLPQIIHSKWNIFAEQLEHISEITYDRFLLVKDPAHIELHGFCDASKAGYGACLYIRSTDASGQTIVRLACAKSRVAPLKILSIPRLELCGALTLARLYQATHAAFNFTINRTIFWSDSTIVLHWLKKSPQALKVFESNRVSEIQAAGKNVEWRHVRTEDNPADALSRGQSPIDFLNNKLWNDGPTWLKAEEKTWPISAEKTITEVPGLRKNICLAAQPIDINFMSSFSNYSNLLNVVALCLRWRKGSSTSNKEQIHGVNAPMKQKIQMVRCVTISERREAERRIIRLLQRERFAGELKQLIKERETRIKQNDGNELSSNKQTIKKPRGNRFAPLTPFLDDYDIIRVGGRLKNAEISFEQKHPILLPSHHHVTDLIIRLSHLETFHAGIQGTLYYIRARFWLIDGKNQVRKIIRRCMKCIRYRPRCIQPIMGNLPESRVNKARPFLHTGVDFFGPIFIKEKKLRNRNRVKAYGCIFICMAVKAVHIEIVSDMTTDGFLGAVRRFVGRRGIPAHMYSDNGSNFTGANNKLQEVYALINKGETKEIIDRYAVQKNMTWHFNPPLSPHFGGIWEAAVKSFKHHFKRVIGQQLLTYEVLYTLAVEIEGILNSRPLSAISSDPNDPQALTPAHILIGHPITMLPEDEDLHVPKSHLAAWKFITKARRDFWRRWQLEYLSELQKRQKWMNNDSEIKIDTIVVMINKDQPCEQWQLGRVVEVHPGSDGIVRVATVKTITGTYKRNVTQLCPLPNVA